MVQKRKIALHAQGWLVAVLLLAAGCFKPLTGKTSLWKVAGKNNTVYLLGSIHFLDEKSYPLDPVIEQAFEQSECLVFEMNLDSVNTWSAQGAVLKRAVYSDGSTLKDHLADSIYAQAARLCRDGGLDIGQFSRFKPWMLTLSLMGVELNKLGFDPDKGIDNYFYKKAKKQDKCVQGLESLDYQLSVFDGLDDNLQGQMILQFSDELSVFEKELNELVHAWKYGQTDSLEAKLLPAFDKFPQLKSRLLTRRNKTWATKIATLLSERKDYMVVVGAGHMVGEDGLVDLLQNAGYRVEQK